MRVWNGFRDFLCCVWCGVEGVERSWLVMGSVVDSIIMFGKLYWLVGFEFFGMVGLFFCF